MHGVRRALILATAERYVSLTVNFLVLVIAARLLTPQEFGIVALGTSAGLIISSLREFVTPVVLIQQERPLTDDDIATSFTLLFLVSGGLGGLLIAASEPIAQFYGQSALAAFVRIVAVASLAEAIVLPVMAVLRRQLRYDAIAAIASSGALIGGATTLGLAYSGSGAVSFAWGWLAGATSMASLCVCTVGTAAWFRPCLKNSRRVLAFGGFAGANAMLHRIYESVPPLAFGRLIPLDALGFYSRATSLCQLPEKILLGGVTAVVLPALSSQLRSGGSIKTAYLRGVEHITALYWPALVSLALLAEPVVLLLLGPQWQQAVPLVQILAIASLFSFSAELNYPMLIAVGAMRDLLLRSLIAWPTSAVILVFAASFGVTALVSAFLIVVPLQAYVSIYFVRRHVPISWREIATAAHNSIYVTLATAAGVHFGIEVAGAYECAAISTLAAAIMLGGTGWLLALSATGHPMKDELQRLWRRRRNLSSETRTLHLTATTQVSNSSIDHG